VGIFLKKSNRLNFILISSPINSTHYARLHPQNGERIVTIDAVTSFHPLYCALYKYSYLLTLTLGIFERLVSDIYAALLCVAYDAVCCYRCSVVCLSVCLSFTNASRAKTVAEPTDMPFGMSTRAWGTRNHVLRRDSNTEEERAISEILVMARLTRCRYSQPYSLGGSSDAASGYQSTVAACLLWHFPHSMQSAGNCRPGGK